MYDVLAVSQFIINYSQKKEHYVSNYKLQCLLYFVQAYFLMELNQKCFEEKIEAWDCGPIIPEVHQVFKEYGLCDILDSSPSPIVFYKGKHQRMIQTVVDKFANYYGSELTKIIFNQTPWNNCYASNEKNEITIEELKEYFCNNNTETKKENKIMVEFKNVIQNINRTLKDQGHSICLKLKPPVADNLSESVKIIIDDKFVEDDSSIIPTPNFYRFLEDSLSDCGYKDIFYNNTKTTFFVKL